ncbi:MAG: hypothetical protein HY541_03850 [Deltaproteobacteria bacterium]|nr:hypothetical protein [Deltaproteobacteria bacterium]
MSYWSVYVSQEDERALKGKVLQIAKKNRWSFSQAVSGILREHLIEEGKRISDSENWALLTTRAFFEGYPERDGIYDTL